MLKTYVVARYTRRLSDWELKAIDGIKYGKVYLLETSTIPVVQAEKMMDEFIDEYPDTISWDLCVESNQTI